MCEKVLSAEPQAGHRFPFCDLDNVEDIPIMPTLSGWLLQYPVVYLADEQTAPELASLLSDATLQLHQMLVDGNVIQVSLHVVSHWLTLPSQLPLVKHRIAH